MLAHATAILDAWIAHRLFSVWRAVAHSLRRARISSSRQTLAAVFRSWGQLSGRGTRLRNLGARSRARCAHELCLRCLRAVYRHASQRRLRRLQHAVTLSRVRSARRHSPAIVVVVAVFAGANMCVVAVPFIQVASCVFSLQAHRRARVCAFRHWRRQSVLRRHQRRALATGMRCYGCRIAHYALFKWRAAHLELRRVRNAALRACFIRWRSHVTTQQENDSEVLSFVWGAKSIRTKKVLFDHWAAVRTAAHRARWNGAQTIARTFFHRWRLRTRHRLLSEQVLGHCDFVRLQKCWRTIQRCVCTRRRDNLRSGDLIRDAQYIYAGRQGARALSRRCVGSLRRNIMCETTRKHRRCHILTATWRIWRRWVEATGQWAQFRRLGSFRRRFERVVVAMGQWRDLVELRADLRLHELQVLSSARKRILRRAWVAVSVHAAFLRQRRVEATRTILWGRERRYFCRWRTSTKRARGICAALSQLQGRRLQLRLASRFRWWRGVSLCAQRRRRLLRTARIHYNRRRLRRAVMVLTAYATVRLRKSARHNAVAAWSRLRTQKIFRLWRSFWLARLCGRVIESRHWQWDMSRSWHRWRSAYRNVTKRRDACTSGLLKKRRNNTLRNVITVWGRFVAVQTRAQTSEQWVRAIVASGARHRSWSMWKVGVSFASRVRYGLGVYVERRRCCMIARVFFRWLANVVGLEVRRCRQDATVRALRRSRVYVLCSAFVCWQTIPLKEGAFLAAQHVASTHRRTYLLRLYIRRWASVFRLRRGQFCVAVTYWRHLRLESGFSCLLRATEKARCLRVKGILATAHLALQRTARLYLRWQKVLAAALEQKILHYCVASFVVRRRASYAIVKLHDAAVVRGARREHAAIVLRRSFDKWRCRESFVKIRRRVALRRAETEVSRRRRLQACARWWEKWHKRFILGVRFRVTCARVAQAHVKRSARHVWRSWRRAFVLCRHNRAHDYIAFVHFINVLLHRSFRAWYGRVAYSRRVGRLRAARRRRCVCSAFDRWRSWVVSSVAKKAKISEIQPKAITLVPFHVSSFRFVRRGALCTNVLPSFSAWKHFAESQQRLHARTATILRISRRRRAAQAFFCFLFCLIVVAARIPHVFLLAEVSHGMFMCVCDRSCCDGNAPKE